MVIDDAVITTKLDDIKAVRLKVPLNTILSDSWRTLTTVYVSITVALDKKPNVGIVKPVWSIAIKDFFISLKLYPVIYI